MLHNEISQDRTNFPTWKIRNSTNKSIMRVNSPTIFADSILETQQANKQLRKAKETGILTII